MVAAAAAAAVIAVASFVLGRERVEEIEEARRKRRRRSLHTIVIGWREEPSCAWVVLCLWLQQLSQFTLSMQPTRSSKSVMDGCSPQLTPFAASAPHPWMILTPSYRGHKYR